MINKKYKDKLTSTTELLKALSHNTRLCIVCKLSKGELNVSQMQDCLDIPQSTVSQHLSILKLRGIIEGRKEGSEVYYSLINKDVEELIKVFFDTKEIPD